MINRNFKCTAKKVIVPLYKSIVRPHLDYIIKVYALRAGMETALQEGLNNLEKVQRRATRMVEGLGSIVMRIG